MKRLLSFFSVIVYVSAFNLAMRASVRSARSEYAKTMRAKAVVGRFIDKASVEQMVIELGPKEARNELSSKLLDQSIADKIDNLISGYIERQMTLSREVLGDLSEKAFVTGNKLQTANKVKGRSKIMDCTLLLESGAGTPKAKAKFMSDEIRFRREKENVIRICGRTGGGGAFVQSYGFADGSKGGVHLMEAGVVDLKSVASLVGPLRGKALKIVVKAMCESLAMLHCKGYVWGDLRLENFVLCARDVESYLEMSNVLLPGGKSLGERERILVLENIAAGALIVKGIDLESVVKAGKPLTDISPEILSPEQAQVIAGNGQLSTQSSGAFQLGLSEALVSSKKTDVWALAIRLIPILTLILNLAWPKTSPKPRS